MHLSLKRAVLRPIHGVWFCSLTVLGCSANPLNDGPNSKTGTTDASDTGTQESADTATDSDDNQIAAWFGLGGTLTLGEERISVELTIDIYGDDSDNGVICTISSGEVVTELIDPTPDSSIAIWWNSSQFEKAVFDDCGGADRLPTQVQLGVGSIHEALLPYLRARGLEPNSEEDAILGTYIGFNDPDSKLDEEDTAYLLGYASPVSTGDDPPADLDALHGSFVLSSIFLHPLENLADTGLEQD